MLLDVISAISEETGLDVVQQRETLVNLYNRAAKWVYDRLECNHVYWEVTLSVPPNKIVSLPPYIGELRGMRASITEMVFNAKTMGSPRYVRKDWSYRWRNWRDLGTNAVMQLPSVIGPLAITTAVVEDDPVEVVINGQTNLALRIEEKVTLNEQVKRTTKLFGPQIYSIACFSQNRTSDISISDDNGTLLAVLYNMDNSTRYKVVDVSEAPWSFDTADGNSLIDVMYKVLLRRFSKDTDCFPAASNYDEALYWISMWMYYKTMTEKPAEFESFMPNGLMSLKAAKESSESSLDKRLSFGRNKYYSLTKGIRVYPGSISTIDRAN